MVVRCDYDPTRAEFVVRMPSRLHEYFLALVRFHFIKQIDLIKASDETSARVAEKLYDGGSANTDLEDNGYLSPDFMLEYERATYPVLILEIAYSQCQTIGRKSLPRIADRYIVESSGNIRTVVGIFIDYQGSKTARLSVWRPMTGRDEEGEYIATEEVVKKEVCEKEVIILIYC